MLKIKEILIIIFVVAVLISLAAGLSFFGVKNCGYNYVELEINPKVEFVTDCSNKVVSVFPINSEAREILIDEQFEGKNIEDAVKDYLLLATKLNYIDVESSDNAIKLTCVSGLTKALEVKLYRVINSYLVNNEIMSVLVENTDDLVEFKQAKNLGVSNDKFSLIEAVLRLQPDLKQEELKQKSERELINLIKQGHINLKNEWANFSKLDKEHKQSVMELNSAKFKNHQSKITQSDISKFKEKFVKNKKENSKKFEIDFNKQKDIWQKARTNSEVS